MLAEGHSSKRPTSCGNHAVVLFPRAPDPPPATTATPSATLKRPRRGRSREGCPLDRGGGFFRHRPWGYCSCRAPGQTYTTKHDASRARRDRTRAVEVGEQMVVQLRIRNVGKAPARQIHLWLVDGSGQAATDEDDTPARRDAGNHEDAAVRGLSPFPQPPASGRSQRPVNTREGSGSVRRSAPSRWQLPTSGPRSRVQEGAGLRRRRRPRRRRSRAASGSGRRPGGTHSR